MHGHVGAERAADRRESGAARLDFVRVRDAVRQQSDERILGKRLGETGSVTVCLDYLSGGTYYEATPGSSITDSFSTPTSYTVPLTYLSTKGKC